MTLSNSLNLLKSMFNAISDVDLRYKIMFAYNSMDAQNNELQITPEGTPRGRGNVVISKAPAGKAQHHAFEGGLIAHLSEMWIYANSIIDITDPDKMDFTTEDVAVSILLHDLSKGVAYKYAHNPGNIWVTYDNGGVFDGPFDEFEMANRNSQRIIVDQLRYDCFEYRPGFFKKMGFDNRTFWLMSRFGISVSEYVFNSIMFAEGGWSQAAKNRCDYGKLGAFLHILDMMSSQVLGKPNQVNLAA